MNVTDKLISHLPRAAIFEIERICRSRGAGFSSISELRLRVGLRSCIMIRGERIFLFYRASDEDMKNIFLSLCGGSMHTCRDGIAEGYISLDGGIRVGIAGHARYDGGRFVGISEVSSLVFRIPTGKSDIEDELIAAWRRAEGGMLIYSPPGVGKTTALRTLTGYISRTSQVVLIDERGELSVMDNPGACVDVLRGYSRPLGIEVALRTLSPEVIVLDEIGGEDEAQRIIEYMNSGVRVLASAHADSLAALSRRGAVKPFLDADVFDVFLGISLLGGRRVAKIEALEALGA